MQSQRPLPARRTVGGKAMHGLRDSLCRNADTRLHQPEGKGLRILPQAVLSSREDEAIRESGQGLIRCIERRTKRVGRIGIANIKIGIQLLRLGAFDPKFVSLQLR